jgi:hypothetical protein
VRIVSRSILGESLSSADALEKGAEARLALEAARAAHQAHDIDPVTAFWASAGAFDAAGADLWFPSRRRGPLGEELRTTDPEAARHLPQWLRTRLDSHCRSIELCGRAPQSQDCPTCLTVESRLIARRLRFADIQCIRRALRRRHRRQLGRQLRRPAPPDVRALVEPLRTLRALGGPADFQLTL